MVHDLLSEIIYPKSLVSFEFLFIIILSTILFFCKMLGEFSPSIKKSVPLANIFEREIQRVQKIILSLDPDLQYDYGVEIDELKNNK